MLHNYSLGQQALESLSTANSLGNGHGMGVQCLDVNCNRLNAKALAVVLDTLGPRLRELDIGNNARCSVGRARPRTPLACRE